MRCLGRYVICYIVVVFAGFGDQDKYCGLVGVAVDSVSSA